MRKWIIGIDEAGRGPLAGPVTVAAFCTETKHKNKLIKILGGKVKDSKQFSPARRDSMRRDFFRMRKNGEVNFAVAHSTPMMIDEKGISKAVSSAIGKCLNKLQHTFLKYKDAPCTVRLDGLLKAPKEYKDQKTIIGGDSKDVFIACASIVAKVSRDRLMRRLSKRYPAYQFQIHKGYGTSLHRSLISQNGLSEIHRKSFCKNIA